MSLLDELEQSTTWRGNLPADDSMISSLKARFPFPFPESYISFLRRFNGGEGCLDPGKRKVYVHSIEELLVAQDSWEVDDVLPGHVLLGTGYDDFGLLFVTTGGLVNGEYPIVMCPISSISEADSEPVVDDFPSLFDRPRYLRPA